MSVIAEVKKKDTWIDGKRTWENLRQSKFNKTSYEINKIRDFNVKKSNVIHYDFNSA